MKKILLGSLVMGIALASQEVWAVSASTTLDLSGHYKCAIYDMRDKALSNELVVTLNPKYSHLSEGYGAYDWESIAPNGKVEYTGSMAATGNTFAMTFDNTSTTDPTDYGTIIGVASYDLDSNGVAHPMLHNFYYEPAYEGGSSGTGTCVKVQ